MINKKLINAATKLIGVSCEHLYDMNNAEFAEYLRRGQLDNPYIEKLQDGLWKIAIPYNYTNVVAAIMCDGDEWYTTMELPRLRTLLYAYDDNAPAPNIVLYTSEEGHPIKRKDARCIAAALWELPYTIKVLVNGEKYTFECLNNRLHITAKNLDYSINLLRDNSSLYNISRLSQVLLQLVPTRYGIYEASTIVNKLADKHIHFPMSMPNFMEFSTVGDVSIIYSPNEFVMTTGDVTVMYLNSVNTLQTLIELQCKGKNPKEVSLLVSGVLEELGVVGDAIKLLSGMNSK